MVIFWFHRSCVAVASDGDGVVLGDIRLMLGLGGERFWWFFSAFCLGHVLEEGSGLQISKLALGLVLGLRALLRPILKLERPTLALARLGLWRARTRGYPKCPFDLFYLSANLAMDVHLIEMRVK